MDSKSTGGIIQILISERDKVYIIWISKISLSKHPIPTHKNENKNEQTKNCYVQQCIFSTNNDNNQCKFSEQK